MINSKRQPKGKTWSRGTINSRLPFAVKATLNLSDDDLFMLSLLVIHKQISAHLYSGDTFIQGTLASVARVSPE